MTDTELLDWLETQEGAALINSDNGFWTVSYAGWQNVPANNDPQDIKTTFFIEKNDWKPTIREALLYAYKQDKC